MKVAAVKLLNFDLTTLKRAHQELPSQLKDTPFLEAHTPGLYLKAETTQPTGAYKVRAAYLKVAELKAAGASRAALSSSGNFAGAFTLAGQLLGVFPHLVVTQNVSSLKLNLAQQRPCQVHVCENRYEARFEKLESLRAEDFPVIDHRNDPTVFLGHATIGLECLPHLKDIKRVLLPVSTGGLALGVAKALRLGGFKGEILGVCPQGNPTFAKSWKAGKPLSRSGIDTCCDALTATSIPQDVFEQASVLLDDILTVEENSVKKAVGKLLTEVGLVVEPGAAVGMAALLELQRPLRGSLLVLSGRNVDAELLRSCLDHYLNENSDSSTQL